jgi:hypothetical protein
MSNKLFYVKYADRETAEEFNACMNGFRLNCLLSDFNFHVLAYRLKEIVDKEAEEKAKREAELKAMAVA